jgi:hypothetical protein
MAKAIIDRAINFTFGPGQAEGFDNVSVYVQSEFINPLTKGAETIGRSVNVALPTAGWDENDVLAAVKESLPEFDVQWFDPNAI